MSTPTHTHTAVHQALGKLMEQVQVYASAWSLVGGPFDSGDALQDAIDAKADLRAMLYDAIASLPATQGEQPSDIERCANVCDALMAKALRESGPEAAGWLHQAASHMRGMDSRPSSVAPGGQPPAHVDEKDALDALDALFGENAIPMSDRNGLLYEIVQTAIQQGNSVLPPVEPSGATLSPCAASQWISVDERLPEPDSGEVLVWLTRNRCRFDEWATYREDPTGLGGPTMDMGVMWRDHEFEEVMYWARITPPTPQVDRRESSSEGGESC